MLTLIAVALLAAHPAPSSAADAEPWWQLETNMGERGTLRLDDKPWWPRAQALQVGQQFAITSEHPGGGQMIVRREKAHNAKYGEMIVWIIDDDGDMDPANPQPDLDSDAYVADHNADGVVDRIVDFIDNDGNNVPDEMDIRYFNDGELRYSWKAFDNDGDGKMWHTRDYEYMFPFFYSDAYGNSMIYLNKYDPERSEWVPFSECPFAFWDTDKDGYSDRVARFSAVPRDFLANPSNPDYANSYALIGGPFDATMRDMGTLNLRYSFDIDGLSSAEQPLHYEMGFNMIGDQRYVYQNMLHENPRRRHPRRTTVVPLPDVPAVADSYPADATGFSFAEFEDGSISIGHPEGDKDGDRRWEGVFWTWHRRLMHNTGGPCQLFNIRREYLPEFRNRREVYYSPVDRRLHLKGAHEGWIRIGKIVDDRELGELRMFDSDGDGYFDRWETYEAGNPLPVRVDRVAAADNLDFGDDWDAMQKFYVESALPEAIRLNELLISTISGLGADWTPETPDNLRRALERDLSPTERRYILDLIRDAHYRHFRRLALERQWEVLNKSTAPLGTTRPQGLASEKAWDASVILARIDTLYGGGKHEQAAQLISKNKDRW